MKLTAEQIQANWDELIGYINTYIASPRKEKLLEFYNKYEDRLMLMPASYKPQFHSCFPGGYIFHVNNVIRGSLKMFDVWVSEGMEQNFTKEELIFSAINHDLGKMGDEKNAAYIDNDDQWRVEKLGEVYKFNNQLPFMSVPDRSLFLLTQHGVSYSLNEFLGIRLHDGIYDEANKAYLGGANPETKPRTSIMYVLHQADLMAARIEFEQEWFPKIYSPKAKETKAKYTKSDRKNQVLKSTIGNDVALKSVIDSFFPKK